MMVIIFTKNLPSIIIVQFPFFFLFLFFAAWKVLVNTVKQVENSISYFKDLVLKFWLVL